jgi:hypothetical protein
MRKAWHGRGRVCPSLSVGGNLGAESSPGQRESNADPLVGGSDVPGAPRRKLYEDTDPFMFRGEFVR